MSTWDELTKEEHKALSTHRLYEVYKRWQKRCGSLAYNATEVCGDDKSEQEYKDADAIRKSIKSILDERDHIVRDKNNGTLSLPGYWVRYLKEHSKDIVKGSIENPEDAIGLQVFKDSKKPFKSKNMYNTVKDITINPHTDLVAFTFEEDESIVNVNVCSIRKIKKATV